MNKQRRLVSILAGIMAAIMLLSLLLSLFNLLPAPMLDGGRALSLLLQRSARLAGFLSAALLLGCGFVFLRSTYGPSALLAGFWVLLGTCQSEKKGI